MLYSSPSVAGAGTNTAESLPSQRSSHDRAQGQPPSLARCLSKSLERLKRTQALALGSRTPRKITQLLDFHHASRWPPTSHACLGHLVAGRILVQYRPAYTQSKKHRREPSCCDRHRKSRL